eukprot:CAMPEP_0175043350 /NCGR_PEP_ID=MMETSP0052_2-20121109/3127_1 /TAXON_ID=51329 ORGANISM="Polytomella parva, Strain SAG 63-3" /NCGR_SAMPLE_ID=MMETSP0052_2 /ASSEMBLY_ACC=CAM_ASM_000194 /LENGTH=198 /DNA_ID=CAMNT_0016306377 /DNA_START=89 /DNA_END=685 /DNA_ORIENTATION=+
MVLVLCMGDLHIPHRAAELPLKFRELLKPGKIHSILCCGNVCSSAYLDHLKTLSSELHVVKGDYDDFNAPEFLVLEISGFKVGLCHGHQAVPWGDIGAISVIQRQLGVDVLIAGQTHQAAALKVAGKFLYLNPGSATGAYHPLPGAANTPPPSPSFALIDFDASGAKATVYMYTLISSPDRPDDVRVERIEYIKPVAA